MPITIQLPPEAERRLTDLAARTGRDVDFYLPEIVRRGLDNVEDCYLAESVRNMELPNLEALREKYRSKEDGLRASGKLNLSVRIRRSLSWTERGQKEMGRGDLDAAFIFHWIGFDAICSGKPPYLNTKTKIDAFLKDVDGADRSLIYSSVIANESKTILTLVANAYVFDSFWDHYYNEWKSANWADSLIESVELVIDHLESGADGTLDTLVILFERLTELRNQLVHGGATWEDHVNRDQVEDSARIMSRLLPVFLEVVIDNPDHFSNADVNSPPPGRDPWWIKAEHNDYVRRLAETAKGVKRSGYREYLREAIERELAVNDDYEFAASVRDILDR